MQTPRSRVCTAVCTEHDRFKGHYSEVSGRERGGRQTHGRAEDAHHSPTIPLRWQKSKDEKRIKNSVRLRDAVSFSICFRDHSGNRLKDVTAAARVTAADRVQSHLTGHYRWLPRPWSGPGPSQVLSPIKPAEHEASAARKFLKKRTRP